MTGKVAPFLIILPLIASCEGPVAPDASNGATVEAAEVQATQRQDSREPSRISPAEAEAELLQLERDYARALIRRDRDFLQRFYAPDWRGGNWLGFWTKSTMLKAVLDERYVVKSMDLTDMQVKLLGQVAVVQGVDEEVTSVNGKDTSGRWTFTDVFERRDGRWVAIASHTAEIRPDR